MPARAWEFAAGALLALLPPPRGGRRLALPIAALGLALLLASIALLNERMVFPGVIVLLPVIGSVLFILAGMLDPSNPISRRIGSRPWTSIGLLSYGFYLWHWPLLALGRYWGLGERDLGRDVLLGGVLALALAWLSYRYVEQPLRRGNGGSCATPSPRCGPAWESPSDYGCWARSPCICPSTFLGRGSKAFCRPSATLSILSAIAACRPPESPCPRATNA